ncbi:serine/threonine protein kinase [Streptomyces sp. BH-SS-21]|uniref:non-specific serine/threonine protein kinase n=2 Tax=Streptomyces liliiviolaceus TaxID=2823109 RepID=A0A941B3B1_9ACTN|nr:serine/threonine-protein kinase [Streptomyces liliiviolaceus]MBQ0849040.1 serine/threonine protein kinase [Streptomyces liliiviolaceus]
MGVPEITRGGIPGLLVTGRYRLVESIGQGGMGRVWRAADETLDRQVAVKEMRIDGMDQEDARTRRERTLREARATARIDHPNVVRVYDVVDEGERLWIVMELVDGRSLERVVAEDGPLSARATARIGLELVAALDQVHAGGVLHRDIKPGNVLIERRAGRVVLTDFGIAAIQNAEALTMVGMLVGSPDYMAPERVSGRPQGPPSDLWSLGATLCAALGGRSPFSRATTLATLHAVLYEEPEIPAAAGEGELRDVLTALLRKDPADRPALEELAALLGPAADGTKGTAALTATVTVPGGGEPAPETTPAPPEPEVEPHPEPGEAAATGPAPEAPESPPVEPSPAERPTPLYVRIPPPPPPPEPEPVEDAVPAGHTRTPEAPAPEPPPEVENTSSEAPAEGTPELPSEGATPGQAFRVPGVRPESQESPTPTQSELPRSQPQSPQSPQPSVAEPEENSELPTRPRAAPTPTPTPAPHPTAPPPTGDRPQALRGLRGLRGRKGLIAVVAVVVAGALAGLLIPMLGGSPGDKDKASPSSSSSPTVAGTARPPSLPAGSRTEAGLYAWVPPDGWDRVVQSGAEVHYTSPDRKQEILANASPARGDLMDQWKKTEETTSKGLDYRRIRLEETTFRGAPAVVWEYTVTAKGLPWHARLLGFDVEGTSYELTTWYHPDVGERALRVYEDIKKSFTPL